MTARFIRRKGFALAVAIFAIVVIGTLVAGGFFASMQEQRIGNNTVVQEQSLTAAEAGLNLVVERWTQTWNTGANGVRWTDTIPIDTANGTVTSVAIVQVTKLNPSLYQVTSEGRAGRDRQLSGRRRIGGLLRLSYPEMKFLGALTTRGATKIGGSTYINGNDNNPGGWGCNPAGAAKPGIAIDDSSKISLSGCDNYSCISGDPKIFESDEAGADSTYFDYGEQDWADLVASANKIITVSNLQGIGPTTTLSGACETGNVLNWGEPRRNSPAHVCESYFPTIYATGNLTLNTGRGQGILLVEGDLHVQGGFEFYGPVIVKGTLKTSGTGGHFNGGVMAANVDLELNTVLGNAVVNYSRCAIQTVLAKSSWPALVMQRSWADLY